MKILRMLMFAYFVIYASVSFSQTEKNTIHELGLGIAPIFDFSLNYKVGTARDLFRIKTLLFSGDNLVGQQTTNNLMRESVYNMGLNIGYERRIKIIDNLSFVFGFDLGITYGLASVEGSGYWQKNERLTPQFNFVIGLNYVLKEHWVFSFETLPYVSYQLTYAVRQDPGSSPIYTNEQHILYGLSLSSVQLVVAYRIINTKKLKIEN